MDKQKILEIKKRLQATTPGAWRMCDIDEESLGLDDPMVETEDGQYIAQTTYDGLSFSVRGTAIADALFIANAKEDIIWLLEQLERK